MSISVTILCNGTIRTATVSCLLESLAIQPEIPKYIGFIVGGYPAYSRNLAVKKAREHNVTHIMFVDADQTFPKDGIKKLVDAQKPIIGANYNERRFPLRSTVKMMNKQGEMANGVPIPDQPFKAFSVATGFMLIDLSVFDKIPYPYFNTQFNEELPDNEFMSEDVYFCINARNSGFDVWCDPTIKVGHIGDTTY